MKRSRILCIACTLLVLATPAIADLIAGRKTVTTSATLIVTGAGRGATYKVQNISAASVFLGDSTVLTTTGYELKANGIVDLPLRPGERMYGIVAAATSDVHFILMPRIP